MNVHTCETRNKKMIDVQSRPVSGTKLGHLRNAWNGSVDLWNDVDPGMQVDRVFAPAENGVSNLEKEVRVSGNDVSDRYISDGTAMFIGKAISNRDSKRLQRRKDGRNIRLSTAEKIWLDATTSKASELAHVSEPFFPDQECSIEWRPDQKLSNRPLMNLHTEGYMEVVTVDASRYQLADTVGQVEYWSMQADTKLRAIVGRKSDGTPSVILMQVAKQSAR
jgi:hypothetical protein